MRTLSRTLELTAAEAQKLSVHSANYILPYIQTRAKRCAIILSNPIDQPKSRDEAMTMYTKLKQAQFDTTSFEWSDAQEIPKILNKELKPQLTEISLLFISIMTHVTAGTLYGANSSRILISDILSKLNIILPKEIILVRKI